ncbi:MAG TPA: pyridoxal phosphate-dependent aminotransferase [Candidatus Acetothermia bacterium]|mgnify:CR=1 FL=1|nr:pyridoxal phosphate-dependent aminotransferase [Candidatus Acetothermia bacterium]
MPKISARAAQAPTSPIRRLVPLADEAKRRGKKVYHLNIGQPDIPTPEPFMRGIREAPVKVVAYSPFQGLREAREAMQSYYADWGLELELDEIIITQGGSEGVLFALNVTCDPGDQILVPEPFYPNYNGFSRLAEVEIIPITTYREEGFHLPPKEEIERLITPRTRAILFSNPGNPTGTVYTRAEIEMLVELALEHDLFLIADEVYREFVYEGRYIPILSFPEVHDRTIMVDSISKRLSACGARIGALVSKSPEIMAGAKRCAMARLSPPTMEQYGLIAFMSHPHRRGIIEGMVEEYRRRRAVLCSELKKIPGVVFREPEGAFYVILGLPVGDAEDFVKFMLTDFPGEETVMLAPGEGFYKTPGLGRDEARIAYVLNCDDLVRACELLKEGLKLYQEARAKVRG